MNYFKKVLIANRGEIALRIIRACRDLKIPTVAIYSDADSSALYVKKAGEAVHLGHNPISAYLNIYNIIDIAKQVGADAIHPGYGFLAENPDFASACESNGICFIGPSSDIIKNMGNKLLARKMMAGFGLPVIPGMANSLESVDQAVEFAQEHGYPVILKATAGGGGRGLRVCRSHDDIERFYPRVKSEAKSSFGNDELFIEKFFEDTHHIEFQIIGDKHGNVCHLGERDCSIQRRHQKLVEIAPSLILDDELRKEMGDASVMAAKKMGYSNIGTIEFLVDNDKNYYFMEMNTRVQVEHTVTEEITRFDMIKEMIKIAAGEKLSFSQDQVSINGYAIECRINAEDPMNNFMPCPGKITSYYSPGGFGVRIDGNAYRGYVIPPYYDSMLAKLTVYGATWEDAVERMYRCLDEFVVRGVKTTIPFYRQIMQEKDFREGHFDTTYVDKHMKELEYVEDKDPVDMVLAISAAIVSHYNV